MSTTTSIRLSDDLKQELEAVSHRLHRGKNWVIAEALRVYLASLRNPSLEAEARRQSLLAAQKEKDNPDTFWEDIADTTGWV
jgi:predicted transcriptional regulator